MTSIEKRMGLCQREIKDTGRKMVNLKSQLENPKLSEERKIEINGVYGSLKREYIKAFSELDELKKGYFKRKVEK